jgi:hypothetical protein
VVALIVSYFLLAYLLIPAAIFRTSSIFIPLKKFQRSRTEEITFAVWISVIPFVGAWILITVLRCAPLDRWDDYKEIIAGSYSDAIFKSTLNRFWRSTANVYFGQSRFLIWYYPLCFVQAGVFVLLVRNYGRWRDRCRHYEWFVDKLLRSVSEWHVLLTTFNFPSNEEHEVAADVLTSDDHLYQGIAKDYSLDAQGALSGIILIQPRRFDRVGYLVAKAANPPPNPSDFWKEMGAPAGNVLYVPREKIVTLNLRYPLKSGRENQLETAAVIDMQAQIAAAVTEQLGDMQVRVESMNNDEIDLTKRLGFSGELLRDCGPRSPLDFQSWLLEKRRTTVPSGEFHFFVNNIPLGSEQTTAAAIRQRLGERGEGLIVRVFGRF